MQRPGLAHDRHRVRPDVGQQAQAGVVSGLHATTPGGAEGDQLGVLQPHAPHALKERQLLWVADRKATLDVVHAELVELQRDAHLLVGGDGHAFLLHAVAQRGVVQRDAALSVHAQPLRPYETSSAKAANSSSRPSTMSR